MILLRFNFNDYLISFNARLHPDFQRDLKSAIQETKNVGFALDNLDKLKIPIFRSGKKSIQIRVKTNLTDSKFKKLAANQQKLLDQFHNPSGQSPMGAELENIFEQIRVNINERFINAGLNKVTGQLDFAIDSMNVDYVESSTGVSIGTANWRVLNVETPPYTLDQDGAPSFRDNVKAYSYRGNNKKIAATGYWAFQEFGTRFLDQRAFILDYANSVHSEDQSLIDSFKSWIDKKINAFNQANKKIIGS